ncbi:mitochondrial import inner membrane translocase subunit TIM14-like [Numida meleagris]|uniref:mitochondrial import inner membrane translocase subunit TIM14-like n=1 Tax=Numida meleagris TaxID=8996 RepID=UPI000B3E3A84|nr:mitochondrial import inner membrane translocase subunit TIM14-like [Numida meleagris]
MGMNLFSSWLAGDMVAVGFTIVVVGFASCYALRALKQVKQVLQNLPKPDFSSCYRGGFEHKMTKTEAALIVGVSPAANRSKIREAYRGIMILNHPDQGSSPYVATKINKAKDLLKTKLKMEIKSVFDCINDCFFINSLRRVLMSIIDLIQMRPEK